MSNRKGFCPDCGCRLSYDPVPSDPNFFALCRSCGDAVHRQRKKAADKVDGFDRDDLGESPD